MSFYAGLRKGSLNLRHLPALKCINTGGMLSAFCGSYSDISVNIVQEGTHQLLELLLDRKVDLAFLNRPLSQLAPAWEFVGCRDHYSLAVPRVHPLAGREEVSLRELRGEHFIFHQTGQVAAELCLTACRQGRRAGHRLPRPSRSTTSLYMVQGGLGVAFLPSEDFRSHTLSGVREIKLEERIVKEVGGGLAPGPSLPVDTAVQFCPGGVK